jgi:prevent-host-death family protein
MKSYTYSEARGNFARVLEEVERDGAVEIRRRDGAVFRILPASTFKGRSKRRRWM